jgi:hypothetical protein
MLAGAQCCLGAAHGGVVGEGEQQAADQHISPVRHRPIG